MKKFLVVFLTLSMILCSFGTTSVFAKSYNGKCGDNLRWEFNGNTLSISGTGKMYDYEYVGNENRPPWIEYKNIEHIAIENGVETIGIGAFSSSESLTSVSLPNSLKAIKKHAFSACRKLTILNLPESLVSIEDLAFAHCDNIKSVIIPGGVKEISYNAFGCCGVEEVIIANGVKVIGKNAFSFCSSLKNVTIPNSVTSIESGAFEICRNLKSVNIPRGVSVDNSAFDATTSINYIDHSTSVQNIDSNLSKNSSFLELKNYLVNNGKRNNGDYVVNCYTDEKNTVDIVYIHNKNIINLLYTIMNENSSTTIALTIDDVKSDYNATCRINTEVGYVLMETTINASSVCKDYMIPKNSFEIYSVNNECITNLILDTNPELKSSSYDAFGSAIYSMILTLANSLKTNEVGVSEKDLGFVNITNPSESSKPIVNDRITVTLNGNLISFDVQPVNINGRVLVPVRAIFEALEATVDWNGEKKEVISTKDDITIKMYQDDATMYKNGQPITLDVPAKNIDGRILVPIRAISEAFGCNVDWDGGNSCVVIRMSSVIEKPSIDFDAKMQKGISYFNQGLYYEAIVEIQSFCDENWGVLTPEQQEIALDYLGKSKQNLADYHYNLGVENYNKGLYYEAQKLFTECLKYYTANSAQWQRANDYLYDTNQKIKELENKQYYSGTEIPSYTSFTGREAYITIPRENGVQYLYKYPIDYSDDSIINESTKYMTKLRTLGWKAYSEVEIEYGISYYFLKGSSMIGVSIEFKNYTVTIGIISK